MTLLRKGETERPTSPWNRIKWKAVTETVRRMQTRIVKALEGGQLGQAKKLQRLLVNSTSAKLLAVRQVVSNRGKTTPGIDGVVWKTPRAKYQAAMNLTSQGYKALPLPRTNNCCMTFVIANCTHYTIRQEQEPVRSPTWLLTA